jgi:hypothetical protein
MMQTSWHDVLYQAGYTKCPGGGFISPSGQFHSDSKVAEIFKMASNNSYPYSHPSPNSYPQVKNYTASNITNTTNITGTSSSSGFAGMLGGAGMTPVPVLPMPYGTSVTPTTPPASWPWPAPSGKIVLTSIFDPVKMAMVTIHVDAAFVQMISYINHFTSISLVTPPPVMDNDDDFSLAEMDKAEGIIRELEHDCASAS